jgi:hypothetical protein
MIRAQKKAGREVVGTIVTMGLPYGPEAELSVARDDGSFEFIERVPDDSDRLPMHWVIDDSNAELIHYSQNPNPKVEPQSFDLTDGILTVNGETIRTGSLNLKKIQADVPGGLLVSDENGTLYRYDVQCDRFYEMHVPSLSDEAQFISMNDRNGRLLVLIDNTFGEKGSLVDVGAYVATGECNCFNCILDLNVDDDHDTLCRMGKLIDVVPVLGTDRLAILVTQPGILDTSEEKDVDRAPIVVDETRKPIYSLIRLDWVCEPEELKSIPLKGIFSACMTADQVVCIGTNGVAIVNPDSGAMTVLEGSDVANVVETHPYYTGRKSVFDADGRESMRWYFTDGETIVPVTVGRDDRGTNVTIG